MNINYQGRQIEVEEVEVINANERWNTYQLADGREISVKLVAVMIARAEKETVDNGTPLYIVQSQNIVKVK